MAAASGTIGTSLRTFLQSELLILSNESRRKHPKIKEALDVVFDKLKYFQDNQGQVDIVEGRLIRESFGI